MKRLAFVLVLLMMVLAPVSAAVTSSGVAVSLTRAHAVWPEWVIELVNAFCDAFPNAPGCDGCMYC